MNAAAMVDQGRIKSVAAVIALNSLQCFNYIGLATGTASCR